MSEKQYLRSIDEGDISLEGRQSNGITSKSDGSVLVYANTKTNITEQLSNQNFQGNIDINGSTSTVMAIIAASKNLEFPEGNNNKETIQSQTNNDPNKITQAQFNNQQQITGSTPVPTTSSLSSLPVTSSQELPNIEQSEPQPALTDENTEQENFEFLSETGIELDPVQIFEYKVGEEIVQTSPIQSDLVWEPVTDVYTGPVEVTRRVPSSNPPSSTTSSSTTVTVTTPTSTKGKLVLTEGVLKGANGDVNQEIHLPNPTPRGKKSGKELPDKYRGKIPVKEAQYSSKLVSVQDMIKLFKANNLSEQEARYMLTLTAAEAARADKSQPYFSGYNFNIFGIQAEGYWTAEYNGVKMSSYITYRYIAQDDYGLRIFAGFNSLKDAVSAKLIACRKKGILTAPSVEKFIELYITTWIAIELTEQNKKEKTAIYNTWGVKFFNQYKTGIY